MKPKALERENPVRSSNIRFRKFNRPMKTPFYTGSDGEA
jgi:hypothetical protein